MARQETAYLQLLRERAEKGEGPTVCGCWLRSMECWASCRFHGTLHRGAERCSRCAAEEEAALPC
jgi:hypothetical protein